MVKNDKSSQSSQRKEGGNSLAMFARDKTNSRRFLFGSKAADQDEQEKKPVTNRKETEFVKEEEEKENCGEKAAPAAKAPILIILDDLEKLENNKNETDRVSGELKSCSPVLNMPTSAMKKPFEAANSSKKPVANPKSNKLANDPTPKITNFLLAKYQHTSVNQFKLNK